MRDTAFFLALTEQVSAVRLRLGVALSPMERAALIIELAWLLHTAKLHLLDGQMDCP